MYKHLSSTFMVAAMTLCIATTWTIVDRLDHTFSAHREVAVNGALKSDRLITASLVQVVERREKTDRGGHLRPVQVAERQRKSDFLVTAALTRLQDRQSLADARAFEFAPVQTAKPEPNIVVASIQPLVFVPVSAGHPRRTNIAAEWPGTSRPSP